MNVSGIAGGPARCSAGLHIDWKSTGFTACKTGRGHLPGARQRKILFRYVGHLAFEVQLGQSRQESRARSKRERSARIATARRDRLRLLKNDKARSFKATSAALTGASAAFIRSL